MINEIFLVYIDKYNPEHRKVGMTLADRIVTMINGF